MAISMWANTQAVNEAVCPRCCAPIGVGCRTPKGRRTHRTHVERGIAYVGSIGIDEWNRRHTAHPSEPVNILEEY